MLVLTRTVGEAIVLGKIVLTVTKITRAKVQFLWEDLGERRTGDLKLKRDEIHRFPGDGEIQITPIEMRGDKARVGIIAQRHVEVRRFEVGENPEFTKDLEEFRKEMKAKEVPALEKPKKRIVKPKNLPKE